MAPDGHLNVSAADSSSRFARASKVPFPVFGIVKATTTTSMTVYTHQEADRTLGVEDLARVGVLIILALVEWHEFPLYDGRFDYVVVIVVRRRVDSLWFQRSTVHRGRVGRGGSGRGGGVVAMAMLFCGSLTHAVQEEEVDGEGGLTIE